MKSYIVYRISYVRWKVGRWLVLVGLLSLYTGYYILNTAPPAHALTGVGALITEVSSGATITVSGRHAPRAEIVVVFGDEVVAAAIDEGTGNFTFDFEADSSKINDLQVFGIDPAGITNRVSVPPSGLGGELLPPTIVQDPSVDLGDDGVGIGGYSYPGASITVSLTGDNGLSRIDVKTGEADGGWTQEYDNLPQGSYVAVATSSFGGAVSQRSQELTFDILAAAAAIVEDLGEVVTQAVRNVVEVLLPPAVVELIEDLAPVAEAATAAVAPVVGVGLLTQLALVARNLFYWILQGGISLLQFFGFWKKRNPWGVVYDGVTKNPLQWAVVRLYSVSEQMKLVATDVSNKSGVFSFFPTAGAYVMKVAKGGFVFPSRLVVGETDGEYAHVYHGEQVKFESEGAVVDVSVPIDPEQAEVGLRFRVVSAVRRRAATITLISLVIGFLMAFVAVAGGSGGANGFLLVFYLVVMSIQVYIIYRGRKSWGVVKNEEGRSVAGVQLNLVDARFERLVQRRVTNSEGKYQFIVPEGSYEIRVASVAYNLARGLKGSYAGQEIVVEGKKPKLIALAMVVSGS